MADLLIAIETTTEDPILAVSAAWMKTHIPPPFDYSDLGNLHQFLYATANVQHSDLQTAVNAVIQRTVEKMYIRDIVPTTCLVKLQPPIVLKPRFRNLDIRGSVDIVRSHWLITAARTLLKEEMRKLDA